jgi:hypothetical protein
VEELIRLGIQPLLGDGVRVAPRFILRFAQSAAVILKPAVCADRSERVPPAHLALLVARVGITPFDLGFHFAEKLFVDQRGPARFHSSPYRPAVRAKVLKFVFTDQCAVGENVPNVPVS